MSCLGYKTSRERDVGKGKSAFFSCNVVPKHIWEVGMGMRVTCKISLSNPLPFPPSHLEMCFSWVIADMSVCFNTCFYFGMGGIRNTRLHLCMDLSRYIPSVVTVFSSLGPLQGLWIKFSSEFTW